MKAGLSLHDTNSCLSIRQTVFFYVKDNTLVSITISNENKRTLSDHNNNSCRYNNLRMGTFNA